MGGIQMVSRALFLGVFSFLSFQGAQASDAMVDALEPITQESFGMAISRSRVRGADARAMLEDYAERVKGYEKGEYKVLMRMSARDFPETDDGQSIVGLARIVDVVTFITEPNGDEGHTPVELRQREALVRRLLFQVRDLGGLIGVESDNWSTCGVSFPGVFILDVKKKEVLSISPANTDC